MLEEFVVHLVFSFTVKLIKPFLELNRSMNDSLCLLLLVKNRIRVKNFLYFQFKFFETLSVMVSFDIFKESFLVFTIYQIPKHVSKLLALFNLSVKDMLDVIIASLSFCILRNKNLNNYQLIHTVSFSLFDLYTSYSVLSTSFSW